MEIKKEQIIQMLISECMGDFFSSASQKISKKIAKEYFGYEVEANNENLLQQEIQCQLQDIIYNIIINLSVPRESSCISDKRVPPHCLFHR